MSIGPFEAVTNRGQLDQFVIGAPSPSRSAERGTGFADHLQSPSHLDTAQSDERPLSSSPLEKSSERLEVPQESSSSANSRSLKPEQGKPESEMADSVRAKQSGDNKEDGAAKITNESTDSRESEQEAEGSESSKPAVALDKDEEDRDDDAGTDAAVIPSDAAITAQLGAVEQLVATNDPTSQVVGDEHAAKDPQEVAKVTTSVANANAKNQIVAKVRDESHDIASSKAVEENAKLTADPTQKSVEVALPNVPTDVIVAEGDGEVVGQHKLQSSRNGRLKPGSDAEGEVAAQVSTTQAEEAIVQGDALEASVDAKGRDTKRERTKPQDKGEHVATKDQTSKADLQDAAPLPSPAIQSSTTADAANASADLAASVEATPAQTTAPTNTPAPHGSTENVTATGRLPEHLLARAASRSSTGGQGSGGPAVTTAEQARLIQRVAKAFQAAESRGGELRLRLSPPELGALRLEVKLQSGVMTARLEAESPMAKAVLLDNLPALKDRLAEQGIHVERFDVDLMDRQPTGQQNSPQDQQQRSAPRSPLRSFGNNSHTTDDTSASESTPRARPNDGRLNVTV
jgi:flagellar hook-length control protein FliK